MRSRKPIRLLPASFLAFLVLVAPVWAQLANVESSSTPSLRTAPVVLSTRELQHQVFDLLNRNDLPQAQNLLLASRDLSPSDTQRLQDWLGQYHQSLSDRDTRRRETVDKHITKAKEYIEQDKLQNALASTLRAALASPSPQDLRNQDWLKDLVNRGADKADELADEGKYGEAALILGEISLIFKNDKFWKQRYEQTGLHASIQGAYGKDSDWQQRLRDVDKDDFKRALEKIARYYVEPVKPADYRKMLLGALKGFRLLLTTKDLEGLFPAQPDQRLTLARVINDTDQKIDSVNKAPYITAKKLRTIYYQTIAENRQALKIPDSVLVDLFSHQALQALDDYTEMIWPDQQKWFARTTSGKFTGIGVSIRINKGKQLEVVTPLAGTPAFRAGLRASDLIVAVDGRTTKGITISGAVRRITGKKGTTVILTIKRPARPEQFDVPIVRDEINIKSVLGYSRLPDNSWNYIVDDREKIAYIRISNFTRNTAHQLDQAIEASRKQGARALILDLRFNPGGTLKGAEEVSDRFLPRDKLIVSTRGYWVKSYLAKAKRPDSCAGWPLVVLTSDKSASAAEIVAGALQDHHRAAVVGERTFGKGLVQRPFPLRTMRNWLDDSQVSIKITTAYWYLPEGRNVQRSDDTDTWGVEPDFHVDLTPHEERSLDTRWRNAHLLNNSNDSPEEHLPKPPPPSDSSPSESPPESEAPEEPSTEPSETSPDDDSTQDKEPLVPDPQLQTALLMARLELLLNQN